MPDMPQEKQKIHSMVELGNDASSTSLSQLLNRPMSLTVPKTEIIHFKDIPTILGDPEDIIAGTLLSVSGDINGYILVTQSLKDAFRMSNLLTQKTEDPDAYDVSYETFDEYDKSALTEIVNIVAGAFVSAVSMMTGLHIKPSVPELIIDMAAAIMSFPAISFGEFSDSVLLLDTRFSDQQQSFSGNFFILPDQKSYFILMKKLEI